MRRPPLLPTLLLEAVVPPRDREQIVGDLVEEHALLAGRGARWYWSQALRTVCHLSWAGFRRGQWLKTAGAVAVAYAAVAAIVMATDAAMAMLPTRDPTISAVLSLAVGLPTMVLGGWLAGGMRRSAPVALAVVTALLGVASLATTGPAAPLWYQLALAVVGPAGALLGGRLRGGRRRPPLGGLESGEAGREDHRG